MPRSDGRQRATEQTRQRRQQLVSNSTFPEQLLWSRLREKQMGGMRFRRQHPIEPYVVDLYCASARVAIELDGRSHDERQDYDQMRAATIQQQGVRLLRISNDDVLENLDEVLEMIAKAVGVWRE